MCENCWTTETPEMIVAADEAVATGIQWLNQNAPENWRELVDLDKLDIDDPEDCILGQVFADKANNFDYVREVSWSQLGWKFVNGYDYAVYTFLEGHFDDDVTTPLGFSGGLGINSFTLTAAWKRGLAA